MFEEFWAPPQKSLNGPSIEPFLYQVSPKIRGIMRKDPLPTISATCEFPGLDQPTTLSVPITGKVSEAVRDLKSSLMEVFKSVLTGANAADDEGGLTCLSILHLATAATSPQLVLFVLLGLIQKFTLRSRSNGRRCGR